MSKKPFIHKRLIAYIIDILIVAMFASIITVPFSKDDDYIEKSNELFEDIEEFKNKDFKNMEKFSHKLDYKVYPLESNDMEVHSPILQAIKSDVDFSAHVLYQSSNNDYFYFDQLEQKQIAELTLEDSYDIEEIDLKQTNIFQKKIRIVHRV